MKRKVNLVLCLIIILIFGYLSGCSTYSSSGFRTPAQVEVNKVNRVLPFDKVRYIPEAFVIGFFGSFLSAYDDAKNGGGIIFIPFDLAEGWVTTIIDTGVNTVTWIPLEGYEAYTNKTWDNPYMPTCASLWQGRQFNNAMNNALKRSRE